MSLLILFHYDRLYTAFLITCISYYLGIKILKYFSTTSRKVLDKKIKPESKYKNKEKLITSGANGGQLNKVEGRQKQWAYERQ